MKEKGFDRSELSASMTTLLTEQSRPLKEALGVSDEQIQELIDKSRQRVSSRTTPASPETEN
ncbi:MAG: hypothetical protein ABII07_01870 [Patescibacteria group bacterium]|nr:hypothetical protein [Patescibacteria group bacterium]